ncbi:cation diffusion facilitator family transporter [Necropsobacter massiliensis]|uniref:cation diffusion facilitator family transporter n=1 Tax=Necropsobacter massiliensis TaxID=1400001 RepID=UPI0005961777|nr:cation diffusion facilitator family transporter [Necropsobacter massiliensis]
MPNRQSQCGQQEHHHTHIPNNKTVLALSLALISGYMLIELLGGYYFNSLVLIADAGHMANDSLSLFLALLALFLSAPMQKWFALLNGISLIAVAVIILLEAVERWQNPPTMAVLPMLSVAFIGLLVNILVARIMLHSDRHNLNIKAAYLHVLADLFGSVVAIIAGLSAWLLHWLWVDIIASALLSLLVLKSGFSVARQAISALRDKNRIEADSHSCD